MRLAVVDDNPRDREELLRWLKTALNQRRKPVEYLAFADGTSFLDAAGGGRTASSHCLKTQNHRSEVVLALGVHGQNLVLQQRGRLGNVGAFLQDLGHLAVRQGVEYPVAHQ